MKLTPQQKTAILSGDLKTIYSPWDDKPDAGKGDEIVLSMSRPKRYADPETKHVFRPPAERAAWIVVTDITRTAKGDWAVYFDVVDNRHPTFYLARGGGYTTDVGHSADRLAVDVDEKTQARITVEARQTHADMRAKNAELRERDTRRQENALRDRLRDTMRNLDPPACAALLAAIERELQAAQEDRAA